MSFSWRGFGFRALMTFTTTGFLGVDFFDMFALLEYST